MKPSPDNCFHLTIEILREIHADAIAEFGGARGVREAALLESAVAAPQASAGGKSPFAGLAEVAAAYLYHLCRNHPLEKKEKKLLTSIAVLCNTPAMLSKELVAASTVPLVLSVLAQGESYGYALIQRVREMSGGRIAWSEGMLYPVLHWMEKQGLIQSEWKQADTGRKRKYYHLRKEGTTALVAEKEQWLTVHTTLTNLWKTQPNSI